MNWRRSLSIGLGLSILPIEVSNVLLLCWYNPTRPSKFLPSFFFFRDEVESSWKVTLLERVFTWVIQDCSYLSLVRLSGKEFRWAFVHNWCVIPRRRVRDRCISPCKVLAVQIVRCRRSDRKMEKAPQINNMVSQLHCFFSILATSGLMSSGYVGSSKEIHRCRGWKYVRHPWCRVFEVLHEQTRSWLTTEEVSPGNEAFIPFHLCPFAAGHALIVSVR
jgi:hypothetical protein